jgi:nucleotide-binding universal stress UspA family protein
MAEIEQGVVVGLGGRPDGSSALERAVELAQERSRPLVLVHAWDPHPLMYGENLFPPFDVEQAEATVLQDAADRVEEIAPGLEVTMHLLRGRAEDVLVQVSEDADLLVVACPHGRTARLGRVLTHVPARAACPVLVVPDGTTARTGPVVLGVDGQGVCAEAVDFAFAQADRWGAELLAVMATEGGYDVFVPTATLLEQANEAGRRYLAEALAGRREQWPDVRVTELVTLADPLHALERAGEDARLLVVGSHGRRALKRLVLGSISASLLRTPPCPVAVVRPHDSAPAQREDQAHAKTAASLPGPLL